MIINTQAVGSTESMSEGAKDKCATYFLNRDKEKTEESEEGCRAKKKGSGSRIFMNDDRQNIKKPQL